MKVLQFKDQQGANAYIPTDLIAMLTEKGQNKTVITLHNDEEHTLKMKATDLIKKLYENDDFDIVVTDAS